MHEPDESFRIGTTRLNRRAAVLGAGAVALGASAGAVVLSRLGHSAASTPEPDVDVTTNQVAASTDRSLTATTPPRAPATQEVASPTAEPAATPAPAVSRTPVADALAQGYVLAVSPRLPLDGIGPRDGDGLLSGATTDWRMVGSGVSLPVAPMALSDAIIPSLNIATVYGTYDELAGALWSNRGAVALVPIDVTDARVKVLSIAGRDPLTSGDQIQAAIRIGIIGDVVPGRNVHQKMVAYGDFTRPFAHVAPMLSGFDLTVANLEGNLSSTIAQPADPHSFSFVSDPAMLQGFANAGIDAVTLANNHTVWNSENWGVQGLVDTIAALDAAGMPYFGAGANLDRARQPWIAKVGDETIAWLGMDGVTANYDIPPGVENGVLDFDAGATADRPGTNPFVQANLVGDIQSAHESASMVIPYLHMGAEYMDIPPDWVISAAHDAIDTGAAMVVTNHPHIVQGMEIYNGSPIVYSPGNFIIDQMWAVEVRSGYALEALARNGRIVGLRMHGVEIEDFHQPRSMPAGEQANLMNRFWRASDRISPTAR